MNLNNISIILNKPQMGENIGASARIMKNFGIANLIIINPRDGWPNKKAIALSAGAKDIIENAKICNSLEDAISDFHYAFAASARKRGMNKPVYKPDNFLEKASIIADSKIAIIFGQENNGLDNEDISLANGIITIPVNPEYGSINLSQSVGIVAYEISKYYRNFIPVKNDNKIFKPSERKDIIFLLDILEEKAKTDKFFSAKEKKAKSMVNIKNMFTRQNFTKEEVCTLIGLLKVER